MNILSIDDMRACDQPVSIHCLRASLMKLGYGCDSEKDRTHYFERWVRHGFSIFLDATDGTRNEHHTLYFPPDIIRNIGHGVARHQRMIEHAGLESGAPTPRGWQETSR